MNLNSRSRSFHRPLMVAPLAALLLLGAAGCGDGGEKDEKNSPKTGDAAATASTPSKSADPDAADKKAAVEAYLGFWDEQVKAYKAGSVKKSDVSKYTGGSRAKTPARTALERDLDGMKSDGTGTTGEPTHKAKVTKFTPGQKGKLPLATVTDCMDISEWKIVKSDTGKVQPFPSNQPLSFTTTAKVEKWPEGWQVLETKPTTKKC